MELTGPRYRNWCDDAKVHYPRKFCMSRPAPQLHTKKYWSAAKCNLNSAMSRVVSRRIFNVHGMVFKISRAFLSARKEASRINLEAHPPKSPLWPKIQILRQVLHRDDELRYVPIFLELGFRENVSGGGTAWAIVVRSRFVKILLSSPIWDFP